MCDLRCNSCHKVTFILFSSFECLAPKPARVRIASSSPFVGFYKSHTLFRRRNKSHKKAKQTGLNKHWEQFRELRRQTTKALATSYKSYVNNQIGDSLKTNPKRFWSFIKVNTQTSQHSNRHLHRTIHSKYSTLHPALCPHTCIQNILLPKHHKNMEQPTTCHNQQHNHTTT